VIASCAAVSWRCLLAVGRASRLLECPDDAVANELVIVFRNEVMDTTFEQET